MSSPLITPSPESLSPPTRSRLLRPAAGVVAGVTLIGAAAAWQGARTLHDKPGEQSLARLVPKEALTALSIDLKPSSMEQVQVMRQIKTALDQEQLPTELTRSIDPALDQFPALRDIKPYLSGSGAFAVWSANGKEVSTEGGEEAVLSQFRLAGFWSVSSSKEVEAVLNQRAAETTTTNGVTIRRIALVKDADAKQSAWATVLGSYLIVGSSPDTLTDVAAVWQGKHEPLTSVAEYTALRATLPDDANLLAYASQQGMRLAQKQSTGASSKNSGWQPWQSVQGAAFSATVRTGGIRFDSTTQTDDPHYNALRNAPPLSPTITGQVPDGAVAFMALAQPRSFFDTAEAFAQDAPADARTSWTKEKASFEKESGLSIAGDILPGFGGDAAVALYPGDGKQPVQWVGLLSDARQAQPAQLLQKVQSAIRKDEPNVRFQSSQEGGATYWHMPRTTAETSGFAHDMSGTLLATDKGDVSLYASVGQSVLTASSRPLLETAVGAYQSPRPVTPNMLPKGAQMLIMVRPARVVDAIERNAPEAFRNESVSAQDLRDVWGGRDIVMSSSCGPKYITSSAFLPVRYEKAVTLLARLARTEQAKNSKNR